MTPAVPLTMPLAIAPAAPLTTPAVAWVLSPSQVNEWLDCSARWWYHHGLQLPDKRTPALAIGEALHQVTAACLRIWQRGDDFRQEDAAEQLRLHLTAALESVELETDEDAEQLQATAARMLTAWLDTIAPTLRGVTAAVEIHMTGRIAGVAVQGLADVITRTGIVVDLKTASKKPAGLSQAHRLQLTTYAMLAEQTDGVSHTEARLVTITKTKSPAAVPQTVEITNADRRYAEWAYATAQQCMRSGEGIGPRRSSTLCSRGNCAYWRHCEAEYGGAVRD